jgi:hypothetical protein
MHHFIRKRYAVARVAHDLACGSMVLADLLCAVFALRAKTAYY